MRTESQGCCTRWQNRTHSPVPRAAPACLQLEKNNRGKNVAGGGNCLGQIVPCPKSQNLSSCLAQMPAPG